MSRPFEITREVELPAAADDVWTAITADTAAWPACTGSSAATTSAASSG